MPVLSWKECFQNNLGRQLRVALAFATCKTLLVWVIATGFAGPALAQQESWLTGNTPLPFVIPENLCSCSSHPVPTSGIETQEQFFDKYSWIKTTSPQEANLAWRVFKAVNRCNANMVIGRLDDTEQFTGQAGKCVLRDYRDWTPAINDAFIAAGTDRHTIFEAVSAPSPEIEIEPGANMREHRRNIYNRELQLVRQSERYPAPEGIENATPHAPVRFRAHDTDTANLACVTFIATGNAGIPGYNREVLSKVSLTQCKDACRQRGWCKSVDYERATGRCYIQPVGQYDKPLKRNYRNHPYDHYSCRISN